MFSTFERLQTCHESSAAGGSSIETLMMEFPELLHGDFRRQVHLQTDEGRRSSDSALSLRSDSGMLQALCSVSIRFLKETLSINSFLSFFLRVNFFLSFLRVSQCSISYSAPLLRRLFLWICSNELLALHASSSRMSMPALELQAAAWSMRRQHWLLHSKARSNATSNHTTIHDHSWSFMHVHFVILYTLSCDISRK